MILSCDENLELRSFQEAWAEELFVLVEHNREHLQPWLTWVSRTRTVQDVRVFLKQAQSFVETQNVFRGCVFWHDQLVGAVGITGTDTFRSDRKGNIGYWLSKDMVGKGIMTRAVHRVLEHAFFDLSLHRIEIKAATDNTKSWSIAQRLGFTREGCLRESFFINGRFLDLYMGS